MMNQNIVVAPHFPDGELVNAFLIRVMSYSGSPSLALACRRLLNRRPSLDGMPSSLGKFHEELGHVYGDIDMLIDKHTEYNFICCGLPRGRFAAQRARLIEMHRGPVRLCRLPLLFNKSENSYLQCPECLEQQKKEFGFSFIHRRTGAPFVNVCPVHGLVLRPNSTQLPFFDAQCQTQPNNYQIRMTMELAKRIDQCMETPAEKSKYHKDDLIQLLRNSGWISRDERFHAKEFKSAFSEFFSGAFADDRLVIMCQSEKHVENAIRALLRADKALHPEWCVLFKWFAEEHAHPNLTQSITSQPVAFARKRAASPVMVPLRETIEVELAKHRTLHATAREMNISASLLSTLCKRHGINVKRRPKILTEHLSNQIRKALKDGMPPAKVAEKFGISVSSSYRQLAALEDVPLPNEKARSARIETDKEEWLQVIHANPDESRNALRKLHSALWMRLYRQAKDWLEANQPSLRSRASGVNARPPRKLLENFNCAVANAVEMCTAPDKQRINISQYRLVKLAGVTPYALQSCEANGSVEKREERRDDFVSARIARIASKVGRPINKPSVIAKKAGLRTETVRKASTK